MIQYWKNPKKRVFIIMSLCLILLLSGLVGATIARYITSITGSSSAGVALWSIEVNDEQVASSSAQTFAFDLFDSLYEDDCVTPELYVTPGVIAPGTGGSFKLKIENLAQVDAEFTLILNEINADNIPIQYSVDKETWYNNISSLQTLFTNVFLTRETGVFTQTIYWRWCLDGGADTNVSQNDDLDSALGVQSQTNAAKVTINATLIVEQFFQRPDAPEGLSPVAATQTSVTLCTIDGAEYSMDGLTWQDSPVFENLTPETSYLFFARYKATADASPSKSATTVVSTSEYVDVKITKANREKIGFTDATTDLVIPETFYDAETETWCRVVALGGGNYPGDSNNSFTYSNNLASVTIPDSVTLIDAFAFYQCPNLKSITFGEKSKLTTIGQYAFNNNHKLSSIDLPNTVTYIGNYAFSNLPFTSIVIPDSVTTIGAYAFNNCPNLTEITFGTNVNSIGSQAFYVSTVTPTIIKGGNKVVYDYAWVADNRTTNIPSGLTVITTPNITSYVAGMDFDPTGMVVEVNYVGGGTRTLSSNDYTILDGTNLSADQAEVTIAYKEYGVPVTVTIPIRVASDYTSFTVTETNRDLVGYTNAVTNLSIPQTFLAEDGTWYKVTGIADNAFANCTSLKSVTMPESLTTIGANAFNGCADLTEITFGSAIENIGSSAFYLTERTVTAIKGGNSLVYTYDWEADNRVVSAPTALSVTTLPYFTSYLTGSDFDPAGMVVELIYADGRTRTLTSSEYTILDGESLKANQKKVTLSFTELGTTINTTVNISVFSDYTDFTITAENRDMVGYTAETTDFTIPEVFQAADGTLYQVVGIADGAFEGCDNLTSLTLPDSVTAIGNNAFNGCDDLTEIYFGSGVTNIGSNAFYVAEETATQIHGATDAVLIYDWASDNRTESYPGIEFVDFTITSLNRHKTGYTADATHFAIPEKFYDESEGIYYRVVALDGGSYPSDSREPFFSCTNLISVTIPDSVTSIGNYAFYGCTNLESVILSENSQLTTMGYSVFSNSGLRAFFIPANFTSFGSTYNPFIEAKLLEIITVSESNASFCSVDGVLYTKNMSDLLSYPPCRTGASFTVPNGVDTIRQQAFEHCANLTSLTFPDSITSIQQYAVRYANLLTQITFGTGVESVGSQAFYVTTATTTAVNGGNEVVWAYNWLGDNRIIDFNPGEVEYVDFTITGSNQHKVGYTSSTTNLVVPATFYDKEDGVWYKVVALKGSSTSPNSDCAFFSCPNLESITLPDSVTSIGGYALSYCNKLTTINLGSGLTSIAEYAFYCNDYLTTINVDDDNAHYCAEDGVLYTEDMTTLLIYPNSKPSSSFVVPNSVTHIGKLAFYKTKYLTTVILGDQLENIGPSAFSGSSLTNIEIPANVTAIEGSAFRDCANLTEITFGTKIENIENGAFYVSTSTETTVHGGNDVVWNHPWDVENRVITFTDKPASVESITVKTTPKNVNYVTGMDFNKTGMIVTVIYSDGSSKTLAENEYSVSDGRNLPSDRTEVYISYSEAGKTVTEPVSITVASDYADFTVTASNRAEIGYTETITDLVIPETFLGSDGIWYKVVALGSGNYPGDSNAAFYNCDNLESITLPDTITACQGGYGYEISYCDNLKTINIGSEFGGGSTTINHDRFGKENPKLENINIAGDNPYLYSVDGAVYSKDMKTFMLYPMGKKDSSFTLSDVTTTIQSKAFYGAQNLIEFTFGSAIASIESQAFWVPTQTHTRVNGANDVVKAYNWSNDNRTVSWDSQYVDFTITAENRHKIGYTDETTDLIIPSTFYDEEDGVWYKVTAVSGYHYPDTSKLAFANCDNLKSITFPDTVTNIGDYAIAYCNNLETINIGKNTTSIPKNLGYSCPKFKAINVAKDNSAYHSVDGVLYQDTSLILYPDGKQDANFTILPYIKRIDDNAFAGATYLTNISIPATVSYIGHNAFGNCTSLAEVTLPEGFTHIYSSVFLGCTSLKTVTLPSTIEEIMPYAFKDCTSLTDIYFNGTHKQWGADMERGTDWNANCPAIIHIHGEMDLSVKTTSQNVNYVAGMNFTKTGMTVTVNYPTGCCDKVLAENEYTILNGQSLRAGQTEVTISYTNSAGITVTKPVSITVASEYTPFTVTASNRTQIGYTSTIEHLVIPETFMGSNGTWYRVVAIAGSPYAGGDAAFYNCNNLISITIPDSVTQFTNDYAIYYCSKLEEVNIGSGFTGNLYMYKELPNLKAINVSAKNTTYSSVDGVVYSADKTKLVRYPMGKTDSSFSILNGVTTIGTYAFYDTQHLDSLIMPNSVTTLEQWCIYYPTGNLSGMFTDITFSSSIVSVSNMAIYSAYRNDSSTVYMPHIYAKNAPNIMRSYDWDGNNFIITYL